MSFWCLQFPPKNQPKQVNLRFHSSKVEFVRLFFGGNVYLKKSFQIFLTFKNWRKIFRRHGCVFSECSFRNYFTPFQNNYQTSRQTAIFILCPTLWIIFKIKYILREIHCCTAGVIHPTNSSLSSFRIMLWTTVQWDVFLLIVRD